MLARPHLLHEVVNELLFYALQHLKAAVSLSIEVDVRLPVEAGAFGFKANRQIVGSLISDVFVIRRISRRCG